MGDQSSSFDNLIETVYALPLEDRLELKTLLEHNIVESRRKEIAANFLNAKNEESAGVLSFSSDINELKKML